MIRKVLYDNLMYSHIPQRNANVFIFSFGKPFLKKEKGFIILVNYKPKIYLFRNIIFDVRKWFSHLFLIPFYLAIL